MFDDLKLGESSDMPETVENNTPQVFSDPGEAAGIEDNKTSDDGDLFVDRLMNKSV